MTRPLAGLAEIADRYDVLLCDVWGVIHNGREAFPIACAALARWRRERGPVILISNSPRPAGGVADQMDALGVPREAWSDLVTSGDVTRDLLAARAPGPAWRIGPERDAPLYEGIGLAFTDLEAAAFIVCTGPNDDEAETPEDYRAVLARGVARGLTMICANPDKVVQRGDKLIHCAGALADLYQDLGGAVVMAGKPFAPIYDLCLARAGALPERPLDARRVLSSAMESSPICWAPGAKGSTRCSSPRASTARTPSPAAASTWEPWRPCWRPRARARPSPWPILAGECLSPTTPNRLNARGDKAEAGH